MDRPVPDWFHDAKLGIFVHWGLYSVPGWAPPSGTLDQAQESGQWTDWFRDNPYAEWYWNSMRIEGSPTQRHHAETYGADFPYEGFRTQFEDGIKSFDAAEWADLFRRAGARYVVPTSKHHDGYRLWPSALPNPQFGDYHPSRDLMGEIADAVRAAGMRFGVYYSGGIDWTFVPQVIRDQADFERVTPQDDAYIAYADGHWRELIERYQPATLFNDIAYPRNADLERLFAAYYDAVPDGVINDRFRQVRVPHGQLPPQHFDYLTPEYTSFAEIQPRKWETCRGVGFSFGYNRAEDDSHFIAVDELIHLLVDIVSKNGNLLLNVGPRHDGSIQEEQVLRLEALGDWLARNGDAIFETRPWVVAEATADDGTPIRFTQKPGSLYATLLGWPPQAPVRIPNLRATDGMTVHVLGDERPLSWRQAGNGIEITLPDDLPDAPAHSLKLSPAPDYRP